MPSNTLAMIKSLIVRSIMPESGRFDPVEPFVDTPGFSVVSVICFYLAFSNVNVLYAANLGRLRPGLAGSPLSAAA
jgi:hypothetical protein